MLGLSNTAAAAGLSTLEAVLTLDSCYLGLGLVLNSGQDASQLTTVLSTLRQHCALAAAQHAHLLRRRAAWLIGWILKTPYFARAAQSACSPADAGSVADGGAAEAVSLMCVYAKYDARLPPTAALLIAAPGTCMQVHDARGAPGRRAPGRASRCRPRRAGAFHVLAIPQPRPSTAPPFHSPALPRATLAQRASAAPLPPSQGLFDTTDTSPRADPIAVRHGSSFGGSSTGSADAAPPPAGAELSDPLARLAASALLPVLHLSLHVKEIDSRWRMGQLLVRLLTRLAAAPALLEPQLPALTEWLPTAWAACEGASESATSQAECLCPLLLRLSAPALCFTG